jgi:hypothetical protein
MLVAPRVAEARCQTRGDRVSLVGSAATSAASAGVSPSWLASAVPVWPAWAWAASVPASPSA